MQLLIFANRILERSLFCIIFTGFLFVTRSFSFWYVCLSGFFCFFFWQRMVSGLLTLFAIGIGLEILT